MLAQRPGTGWRRGELYLFLVFGKRYQEHRCLLGRDEIRRPRPVSFVLSHQEFGGGRWNSAERLWKGEIRGDFSHSRIRQQQKILLSTYSVWGRW